VLSQVCCAGFGAALLDGVAGVAGAAAAADGGGGAAADAIATAGLDGVAAGAAAADELTLAELQTLASGDTTTSTRTGRPTGTSPAELRDTSRVRGFARARMPCWPPTMSVGELKVGVVPQNADAVVTDSRNDSVVWFFKKGRVYASPPLAAPALFLIAIRFAG
jgi:hypothetical protein